MTIHTLCSKTLAATRTFTLGAAVTIATFAPCGAAAHGGDTDLSWHSVDGGGGSAAGGAFDLRGTIGQPDASDALIGGTWSVAGGFWASGGASAPPCPSDLDGSGAVDFGDLVAVLSTWGACPACPEDLDGSGAVDFNDLVTVLAEWGACP